MMRALRLLLSVVAILHAAPAVVYLVGLLRPERALDKDFGQEYLLARAVSDGINPYVPIRELASRYLSPVGLLDKPFPTPHPPSVGVLFAPFLLVDYPTAVLIWTVLEVAGLLVGLCLVARATDIPVKPALVPVVAFALIGWLPVMVDIGQGQVTLVMLGLLAGAWLLFERGRLAVGGVLLGVALAIKPLAWPWLLVLAWHRNWSAVIGAVGVVGLLIAVFMLRVGVSPTVQYFTSVLPSVSAGYATEPTNNSVWTIGPRLFGASHLANIVAIAIPVLMVGSSVIWLLRTRPSLGTALSVMTCLSVLVSPISWEYDQVLLIIPGAQVIAWLYRCGLAAALFSGSANFPRSFARSVATSTAAQTLPSTDGIIRNRGSR